ncbi:NAD(P)H-dependent oxidoreductase [Rhizobium sp. FKY42]|uniref:FMN-dependent NADH-azoreductase n=1 Tax=Rhizobium sp. FKY42 TaxID=2562310 RepID=UPI0010BF89F8|nr:NAD(P)H-dependent oxidoreductase [Rhizobium sp. FKY42]
MPTLLHIHSSPNLGPSVTRSLSSRFVERFSASHPDTTVDVLDLAADPLPHFGPANMAAAMTPPENFSEATRVAVGRSAQLIDQIMRANVIVLGVPMINFTAPTQLKAWIDHISIPQKTFRYTGPGKVEGLVVGKRVFLIAASGMDYSTAQGKAFDFLEPMLRWQLGFLGMTDLTVIRAQGMRMFPEKATDIMAAAEAEVDRLALG